jgi:rRNA maturation protein Nop10
MSEACPKCKEKSVSPRPPKYSPDDKYAEMKRKAKDGEYKGRNLV